jgi:radical SAM superfamily enzyme YgiQ (UPF0313 family)
MYTSKQFNIKSFEEISNEILQVSEFDNTFNKIFLADGDSFVLSTSKLIKILELINEKFPKVRRISSYAKPKDLASKSVSELKEIKNAGLKLVYVGIESGSDNVLKMINKGETFDSTVKGLLKAKEAGIQSSVMILNGLGGKKYTAEHAIKSAELLNIVQPEFASTLVLSFPFGEEHFKNRCNCDFESLSTFELLWELKYFIENTNLQSTVFRSDHASNYLVLKGILGRDKEKLITEIDFALKNPDSANLREEYMRGL